MAILGIDIGGSGIKGAPVDVTKGEMLTERFRIPTPGSATPDAVADIVVQLKNYFNWSGPIGCTVPARVERGLVRTAANIHEDWIDTPVETLFSGRTGCPVGVLNDADAAGIASMEFGAGKGRRGLVVFLTVGTGIGSALFMDGVLVPNTELGHLVVNRQVAELYASDRTRKTRDLSWKEWATRFQAYLNRIEFLFAPDSIIIGGGVSRAAKAAEYFAYLKTNADLITESLENEAGIIGAAFSARHLAR